jgi:hypothetical protein
MTLVLAGAVSSCSETDCCSPFAPVYRAVAYGTVTQGGQPATGIEVRGEVFPLGCGSGGSEGMVITRSGSGGAYRLLLSSPSQAAGQCLRMSAGDGEPFVQTLTEMAFTAQSGQPVQDSIQINIDLP